MTRLSASRQFASLALETGRDGWQRTMEAALTGTGWTWSHSERAVAPAKGGGGKWLTPTRRGFPDELSYAHAVR